MEPAVGVEEQIVNLPPEVWSVISSANPENTINLSKLAVNANIGTKSEYATLCQRPVSFKEVQFYVKNVKPIMFAGYLSRSIDIEQPTGMVQSHSFAARIMIKNFEPGHPFLAGNYLQFHYAVNTCFPVDPQELRPQERNNFVALGAKRAYYTSLRNVSMKSETLDNIFTFDYTGAELESSTAMEVDFLSQYHILLMRRGCAVRFGREFAKNEILRRIDDLERNANTDIVSMSNTAARLWIESVVHNLDLLAPPAPGLHFSDTGYNLFTGRQASYVDYNRDIINKLRHYYRNIV